MSVGSIVKYTLPAYDDPEGGPVTLSTDPLPYFVGLIGTMGTTIFNLVPPYSQLPATFLVTGIKISDGIYSSTP